MLRETMHQDWLPFVVDTGQSLGCGGRRYAFGVNANLALAIPMNGANNDYTFNDVYHFTGQ